MREKLTITVEYGLYNKLKKLSEMSRIPASRLFDEAVIDLLIKHNYEKMLTEFEAKSKDEV